LTPPIATTTRIPTAINREAHLNELAAPAYPKYP
jgi:hypothetical protein